MSVLAKSLPSNPTIRPAKDCPSCGRKLPKVLHHEDIPDTDCGLQLEVIAACWRCCVTEGAAAVRRMLDCLVDATYLPGPVSGVERGDLREAVGRYRRQEIGLGVVQATLERALTVMPRDVA